MGGLFLDGEESPALEDISKWTVEDVCSFVSNLSGCTEYTQVNLHRLKNIMGAVSSLQAPVLSLPPVPISLVLSVLGGGVSHSPAASKAFWVCFFF